MGKFIITEEDKKHIRALYEQSTTGLTINQMLQGKEFPGLTKQEQENIVYYSLLSIAAKGHLSLIIAATQVVISFNCFCGKGPSFILL